MKTVIIYIIFLVIASTAFSSGDEKYVLNTEIYNQIKPLQERYKKMTELTQQGRYVDGGEYVKLFDKIMELNAKATAENTEYFDHLYEMNEKEFDEIARLSLKTDAYLDNISVKLGAEKYEQKFHEPVERVYLHMNQNLLVSRDDCPDDSTRDDLNNLISLRKSIYSKLSSLDPRFAAFQVQRAEAIAKNKISNQNILNQLEKDIISIKKFEIASTTCDQVFSELGDTKNINQSGDQKTLTYVFPNLPNNQTVQILLQFNGLEKLIFISVKKQIQGSEGWQEVYKKGQVQN
jgi:hypothetical protein